MPPIDGSFFLSLLLLAAITIAVFGLFRLSIVVHRLIFGPSPAERLLTPQIDEVERALGYSLPSAVHQLYADQELIQEEFLEYVDARHSPPRKWDISEFSPADPKELKWTREWLKIEGFVFAYNGYGEAYVLRRAEQELGEQPIYLQKFEGHPVLVAESLDQFLRFKKSYISEEDGDDST